MSRKIIPIIFLILLSATVLTSSFIVQPVKAVDYWKTTIYIKADGNIEPTNASIQRNGNIYTLTGNIPNSSRATCDVIRIEKDNIILDGAGYSINVWDADVISYDGVILEGRNNVTLKNLRISQGYSCVRISNCTQITLTNSSLDSGSFGMGCNFYGSTNCSIIGNNLDGVSGIYIKNSSNNLIIENNIIRLSGMDIQSDKNTVYHNNVSATPFSARNILTEKVFWDNDYPSGGNFWSNYNGTDNYHGIYQNITGSDGIGDTPYVLKMNLWNGTHNVYTSSNIIDRYPLMKPYLTELVIPEFSSTLILPLFITLTLLTSIIYFKKHKR